MHTTEELKTMSLNRIEAELSNAIYDAARILESLEYAGRVRGNGHHARQAIAKAAVDELRSRWVG